MPLLNCALTRHGRNTQTRRVTLPSLIFYSKNGNLEGKKWNTDTTLFLYPEIDMNGEISIILDDKPSKKYHGYPCSIVKTVSQARQLTIPYQILHFLGWNSCRTLKLDWVGGNRLMFLKGDKRVGK